jgi:hypothetical protein
MIDVNRGEGEPHLAGEPRENIEQHNRIDTAAQAHDQAVPGADDSREDCGNTID